MCPTGVPREWLANWVSGPRPAPGTGSNSGRLVAAIGRALVLVGFGLFAVTKVSGQAAPSVLSLTDEGFLPGEIRGSADPRVLRWSSPYFAQPLEFPLGAIRAVHYKVPAVPTKSTGQFCFELDGDDVLFGNLLALTPDEVEIDSPRIGRVHLRRPSVRRIYPWKGGDAVYLGPNGLKGWKDAASTPQWRDEGGQLVTDRAGASIVGDVGIPAQAIIEFELSWKQKPDFVFAAGAHDSDDKTKAPYRFEVWDNDLVVLAEAERDADAADIQPIGNGAGHVHLQVYLDQPKKRLLVLTGNGKQLADLHLGTKKQHNPGAAVRLTNLKGDVRLEYLRVTRWNGVLPGQVQEQQSRLLRTDGTAVYGQITAYNPESKQFTLRGDKTETTINADAITDLTLSPALSGPSPPKPTTADKPDRTIRVVYQDGSRLSGAVGRIEDASLSLTCPGIKESLRLPFAELRSLHSLQTAVDPALPSVSGRSGRLEMEGTELKGCLVNGAEQPGASCLVWHPLSALNASPLKQGVAGRIVYRDPPPPPPPVQPFTPRLARVRAPAQLEVKKEIPSPETRTQPFPDKRCRLHLRSGDTLSCDVSRIDDRGVTIKSPILDATFIAHDKIKSVELVATKASPGLNKIKRDRLLTLPRMQRDSPPTHLICSTNGDFLRGRILEMDDKRLIVEVRLENKEIARELVAQIIWLHADELAAPKTAATGGERAGTTRVQSFRAPDNRLTFTARNVEVPTISGVSDVLGTCHADLSDADELLLGAFIDQAASKLAYNRWKLHYAVEPKFVQAGGSESDAAAGLQSPLCGQPAFNFKLDLLDGSAFRLADHKGQFVVLDFWATWCGPCMQTMPLVDEVVRGFAGQKVELIAVNLEEQPDQIKATLERHKLKIAVALDRDGVVAAKYGVTAIPQTVIVDRDGKIVRLFVGGGPKTAELLKKALQELTSTPPAPPPPNRS
jgi:thiol-disulfide isomerase/thioredoxin